MNFLMPQWLWAVPGVLVFGLVTSWWTGREFHRRLALFVTARLRTAQLTDRALLRKRLRILLRTLAVACLCVALARPLGNVREEAAKRQGINALIALDGSRSMLAEDVKPNRFTLAQKGIDSLLTSFNGDRAALMMFAGEPIITAPLSFDTVSLEVINQGMTPELVGKGGTSLSAVIKRAQEYFRNKSFKSKVLILFSDGEETEGDAVVAAQEAYQKDGIRIFTVGTGTSQGATIPRLERNAERDLVRVGVMHDEQGKEAISRLNETLLRTVSSVAGGSYVNLEQVKGNLASWYVQWLKPLSAPMEAVQLQDLQEWYPAPLGVAVLLLILEMLIPWGRSARQEALAGAAPLGVMPTSVRRKWAPGIAALWAIGLTLVLMLAAPSQAWATATLDEARQLMAAHEYAKAFTALQSQLLRTPDDELANYNYALAAYAAGKYTVAIERFEKLTQAGDPRVQEMTSLQLGNSLYRQGEEMLKTGNPEGAVILWQKALTAYQRGGTPATAHNLAKTQSDLMEVFTKLARAKETAADEEARLSSDKGIPGWQEAVGYLDQAVVLAGEDERGQKVRAWRQRVAEKVFNAYLVRGDDSQRQANFQKEATLEMAIEAMQSALSDYEAALVLKPNDKRALAGKRTATEALQPWLVRLADQQHQQGVEQYRSQFLDDAIVSWNKAGGNYSKVLEHNPKNAAAQRGQEKNNGSLHDGYVELGDSKQKRAENSSTAPEKDALLEDALGDYQTALRFQPKDGDTLGKVMRLGKRLTGRFVERGSKELSDGKKIAAEPPPAAPKEPRTVEAIAFLERSVQSFGKALRFEEKSAPALSGKKEAEDLLKKLRDVDADKQRRLLAKNRQLNNAQQLDDARKLALKLLDYDTQQLASRKQQQIIAPENKVAKDW